MKMSLEEFNRNRKMIEETVRDKYLYFLGAGASANSLPLVSQFSDSLGEFRKFLKSTTIDETGIKSMNGMSVKQHLIEKVAWLIEMLKYHASIDTYAKKLYFKNDFDNLRILKSVLSCFFVGIQSINPVDYRYDSFFASIIKKEGIDGIRIPDNIKFLSWNYDLQIEKAYYGYCDDKDKVIKDITLSKENRIYRLNGYCGTTQDGHIGKEFTETFNLKDKMSKIVIELYAEYLQKGNTPNIKFAWEINENYFGNNIHKITDDIKTLIIIGYSFPFFNREIDKRIFQTLEGVSKIYIQTPSDTFIGIKERLATINRNLPEPKWIEDVTQFYIPFEYNL